MGFTIVVVLVVLMMVVLMMWGLWCGVDHGVCSCSVDDGGVDDVGFMMVVVLEVYVMGLLWMCW